MNDCVKTSINDLIVESKLKPCGWLDYFTYVFGKDNYTAPEEMKDGVRIKPVDWHVYEVNDIIGGRIFETEILMYEEILERYGSET